MANSDPYLKGELTAALTRSYQIDQFSWATTDTQGTLKTSYVFPYVLMQLPFLADKLKYYAYFRSKIRITFRINTTKFEYGTLLISRLPFYDHTNANAWRHSNLFQAAQNRPILLSAQQGSTVSLEMDWINPKQYQLMSSPLPEIGTVFVHVLHPLTSVSTEPPPSISVTVFAQFVDPEVAGFAPDAAPPTPMLRKALIAYNAAQEPLFKKRLKRTQSITSTDGDAQSSKKGGRTVAAEAQEKSEKGVLTGVSEAVMTIAPMLSAVPVIGEFAAPAAMAAAALHPILSMLGLNKPMDVAVNQVVFPRGDPGLSYGKGLDQLHKLSLDPKYTVSTTTGLCGTDNPQPSVKEIIMTPSLLASNSFNNTTSVGAEIVRIPVHANYSPFVVVSGDNWYLQPYVSWYAQFFKFWRGSLKYLIRFNTSSFVTTRVRISHLVETITSSYASVSGDLVSKVVDINGDTEVALTVPYINPNGYVPCLLPDNVTNFVNNTGCLTLSLVDPITSTMTTNNPVIYYDIWVAAGPDFQYLKHMASAMITSQIHLSNPSSEVKLKLRKTNAASSDDGYAQCDINKTFSVEFPGLVPAHYIHEKGLWSGEDPGALNTLLHRYAAKLPQPGTGTTIYYPWINACYLQSSGVDLDNHFLLGCPFLFWRGAARTFSFLDEVEYVTYSTSTTTDQYADGVQVGGDATMPIYFEAPYMENRLFMEMTPTIDTNYANSTLVNRASTKPLLYSMGDDFSVGSLSCVPWYITSGGASPKRNTPKRLVFNSVDLTDFVKA